MTSGRYPTLVRARCPRCADGSLDWPSYAHLLGWYLGDGHISRQRRDVFTLSIVNDRSYPLLNGEISELLARAKPGSHPYIRYTRGAVVTTLDWKHWPCLFPQHGPGRKHERQIALEAWQQIIVDRYPGQSLRGM